VVFNISTLDISKAKLFANLEILKNKKLFSAKGMAFYFIISNY
jgi:hypothetical protein